MRIILGIALILVGCTREAGSVPGHTVSDSAGVRTVASMRPAWDSSTAWVIDTTPLRAVGGDERDSLAMLQVVAGAMRQGDGTVVVADRGSSQLKYYDPSGKLVRTVSRHGRGPGEFEYIGWLLACGGDSAFVSDIGNRQVSVIAPDGRVTRRFSIETSEGTGTPFTTSCARNGGVVTTGWGDLRQTLQQDRPFRPQVPVDLSGTDGRLRRALGRFPGTEMAPVTGGSGPRVGGRWLRVAQARALTWVAPNDGRGLMAFDSLGALHTIARFGEGEPPLTGDDARFLRRLVLDSSTNARQRAQLERELGLHPLPDRLPQHFALLVDAADHLWVQPHPRAEWPQPAWEVLSPDGVWLGVVALPAGARALEIGLDYVLAVRTAESGAEEVVELRLERRPAR